MALIEEMERQGNWLFRYRSYLPIVLLFGAMLVHTFGEMYPNYSFIENSAYEIHYERFCLVIALFGLAIRIYAVGHTPAHTSGRNTKEQLAEKLNTTGIYSQVRHPLYLGIFFIWLGLAMMTANLGFILLYILAFWLYYERIMIAEEQFLRRKFGEAYEEWAATTPAFFPSLSKNRFVSPSLPFSWKKVLKKEKNGLAAIFLIFALYNIIELMIDKKPQIDYTIVTLCVLTGILYLILKIIKYNSHLLTEEGR
jgi:protein-S-isoprenylcysteine O-methyltransferase Ste14